VHDFVAGELADLAALNDGCQAGIIGLAGFAVALAEVVVEASRAAEET